MGVPSPINSDAPVRASATARSISAKSGSCNLVAASAKSPPTNVSRRSKSPQPCNPFGKDENKRRTIGQITCERRIMDDAI